MLKLWVASVAFWIANEPLVFALVKVKWFVSSFSDTMVNAPEGASIGSPGAATGLQYPVTPSTSSQVVPGAHSESAALQGKRQTFRMHLRSFRQSLSCSQSE